MVREHMQIGEVAARTGLSLRTIRYYEEMGLVTPSTRSAGRFRLYAEADLARLELIKRMKPLDFSLEEMRDLLSLLDTLEGAANESEHAELVERLEMFHSAAHARVLAVREQLAVAEGFAAHLQAELRRHRKAVWR